VRALAERAGIDVLHYDLRLDLRTVAEKQLSGAASLSFLLRPGARQISFDLAGMEVDSVLLDGVHTEFRLAAGVLSLLSPKPADPPAHEMTVFYHGSPSEGLIFGRDGAGDPTAFADNWPNRARWWFPANDHPSDKATVRFDVRVPGGWSLVANGARSQPEDRSPEADGSRRWEWETRVPIPVYTMVIGLARFSHLDLGRAACGRAPNAPGGCVRVSVWALRGDSAYGAERFRRAVDMVDFFAKLIGPFSFEKLTHVESSTRFGGMENSSAIFYPRVPWSERRMSEGVIAHETAHQWFGDAVTPARWGHLWLSEGFASYFGPLYFRDRDGEEAFRTRMAAARARVLDSDVSARPVIDEDATELYSLLNSNNYQKGAWILHMLRGVVGDSAFFRGVREYYREHRDGNVLTEDFQRAMEKTSDMSLEWFFRQWLYQPGFPQLRAEWWTEDVNAGGSGGADLSGRADPAGDADLDGKANPAGSNRELVIAVSQTQPPGWPTFRLPMEVAVRPEGGGAPVRRPILLSTRADTVRLRVERPVADISLDPGEWVLGRFEISHRGETP